VVALDDEADIIVIYAFIFVREAFDVVDCFLADGNRVALSVDDACTDGGVSSFVRDIALLHLHEVEREHFSADSRKQEGVQPFVGKALIDQVVVAQLGNGITEQRDDLFVSPPKITDDLGNLAKAFSLLHEP